MKFPDGNSLYSVIFFDGSAESPQGRTIVGYDREGLPSRKEHRPENNAMDLGAAMGIERLPEAPRV
jgi:hypothetical protein